MSAFKTTTRWFAALLLAGMVAGCGGRDDTTVTPPSPDATADVQGDGDHDDQGFAFGEPAAEADADRTVEVTAHDDLRFDPDHIEVAAGETITFVITNVGEARHDFTLGDEHAQEEHAQEMREMGADMRHDEPNSVTLEPGETKRVTWRFAAPGTVLIGCHEPGHYEGGMIATITVTG